MEVNNYLIYIQSNVATEYLHLITRQLIVNCVVYVMKLWRDFYLKVIKDFHRLVQEFID